MIHVITEQHSDKLYLETIGSDHDSSTALLALRSLVDIVSGNQEIKELVWSPIAAYDRTISARAIKHFEQELIKWRNSHSCLIPELDTDRILEAFLTYGWSQFAMPPPPYPSTTRTNSLAAAHYSLYIARVKWSLILLEDDVPRNKPMAEFYLYEALRHAASHAEFLTAEGSDEAIYIPCEALTVGLLPVLHIVGLCSPQPLWLEWIKELSDRISQEGVLKGHTFATNLDCLHKFETYRSGGERSAIMERYPDPAQRTICQLIPETDGRHFTSFFAAPSTGRDPRHTGLAAYRVIGNARWKCNYGEGPCTPVVNMYDGGENTDLGSFSMEWLYSKHPALDWQSWSQKKEFHMDRALQDHISGTRLLLAADNAMVNGRDT